MTKILITGGSGMVGNAFKSYENTVLVGSKDYDLTKEEQVYGMMDQYHPDQIIHLSARVGGVLGNMTFPADYFRDNIKMNTNVLEAARVYGVKKVISLLSTCVYPDAAPYPLTEKDFHAGEPHPSNFSYAYAKRMLEVQSRAYRIQYGLNYITCIPNNLYGENDNFEKEYSHVIPALIRKFYEAKKEGRSFVQLWGTGEALREFTYSGDIAKIIMWLLENYNDEEPINIGDIREVSVKYLAELIQKEIGFEGQIVWDTSKPTGQLRKPSNNQKFKNLYPSFEYTSLEEGVKKTCQWFEKVYPNIRGL